MAAGIQEPDGKRIGTTTLGSSGAAGAGAGLGAAIGAVVVFSFEQGGVDLGPIEWAVVAICSALLSLGSGLIGGKYSPSNQVRTIWGSTPQDQVVPVPAEAVIPDGDGSHRATTATDELEAEVDAIAARAAASRQGGVA